MLQLQPKDVNICRISKLLVKYNVKASITNQVITLDGDVSDELLTELCGGIDINAVQNFISQEPLHVPKETSFFKSEELTQSETVEIPQGVEEPKKVEIPQPLPTLSHNTSKYDLIYSEVKRGEVYLCDFGEPYGSEQGFQRYAIVIQNDDGNLHSPTTIVIACTTKILKRLPVHYYCTFSSENMVDYDFERVGSRENVIMAEQMQTVDKTRLRKYIGTLTPEFMKKIEGKIDISLHLSREVKTIVKQEKVYVDRPSTPKAMVDPEAPKERKDVNMVQVQLLSFVDINDLMKISQIYSTDEVKAKKILKLFGFDFKKKGVEYLIKAIISSPKDVYFNLETLSEIVSKKEGIDKEEIKRLIVARVKETFGFKKAPTIDFIRLVNSFLTKQEEKMKKITFKVSSQKENSVISLIKEVNKISCRICLDIEHGFVTVQDVDESMIDTVIELVDNYYTILSADIDNTAETSAEKAVTSKVAQETINENTEGTQAVKQPKVLEPQSEDDLIIKKVEFQNKAVEEVINKLLRSFYWAMFKKNAQEKDIISYIYTCLREVSINYSPEKQIDFNIGDIVNVDYGMHLKGEINGSNVIGIVCDILGDMAYIVPITKAKKEAITSCSYIEFTAPTDVLYTKVLYEGGTALLDKGKYLRVERFKSVDGKTKPEFFTKLIKQLATAFDFTRNIDVVVENDKKADAGQDDETVEENITVKAEEKEPSKEKEDVNEKETSPKKVREEDALMETIGFAFNKLDAFKTVKEQINDFMTAIGMDTSPELVRQSFDVACNIKRINYENVILELRNINSTIKEDIIKASLQEYFKGWLKLYPELAQKCPRISIMSLLKVFVKNLPKG